MVGGRSQACVQRPSPQSTEERLKRSGRPVLELFKHSPYVARVYLRLTRVAQGTRKACRLVYRAQHFDPEPPHLERRVDSTRSHVADLREEQPLDEPKRGRFPQQLPEEEPQAAREGCAILYAGRRPPGRAAVLLLDVAWRALSVVLVAVALIFLVALLVGLGRRADLGGLAEVVRGAGTFTVGYLRGLARGDLGVVASGHPSVAGAPVVEELRRALPLSLGLLATALSLAAATGLALGAGAAVLRRSRISGGLLFASLLGISTPSFFAAMLLIWLGLWLYKNTGVHFFPIAGFGWDAHLILPALVLAARPAAAVTRLSYHALVDVLEADYIRTATAKGLGPRVVLLQHVVRSAGVPLLTTLAVSLRFSLAILPIVEYIFNWPGIGRILLTAIEIQDTVTLVGMTLPLVLLFFVVNLLLEILYPLVDPRQRDSEASAV